MNADDQRPPQSAEQFRRNEFAASGALPGPTAGVNSARLAAGIERTRQQLLGRQYPEGYFVGELEGDTILESEYILLLAFIGQGQTERAKEAAAYMLAQQNPDGGWASFPGGPTEVSGSAKAYLALLITGHARDAEYMVRARQAVIAAGGVEKVNSFTRYYLAMLGLIPYELCPAVPPEMILLPHAFPLSIYQMSAWSRTIVVPLSLLWAFRPIQKLPAEVTIQELFANPSRGFERDIRGVNHEGKQPGWIDWTKFFHRVDRCLKLAERIGFTRLTRGRAVRLAEKWILDRLRKSDGLGAIFPPIIWTIIGLKCLGYQDDHPVIQEQFGELEKLVIRERDPICERNRVRLQPCLSPVWDTAIATIALRDAGVPAEHPALRNAVKWLLSKEVREPGDWSLSHPQVEPAGWYFEFNNEFYPDVDDTSMVLIALSRCLPQGNEQAWKLQTLLSHPHDTATVVAGKAPSAAHALSSLGEHIDLVDAIRRGAKWLAAMQCKNGGWGAFDADNDREVLTKVPFADHNAMIDPPTGDISARVLESFAAIGVNATEPAVQRALQFIWNDQQPDGCWFGRWGVNYIYGTWQVLVGLVAMGIGPSDPRLQRGAAWLKQMQQANGGWGETPQTYDDPSLRGTGTPTASQTAWAVLGLVAVGEANCEECRRGVEFLLTTQREDGTWHEPEFTGTGFPRVFYLRYHLYALYFPLMALARFAKAVA